MKSRLYSVLIISIAVLAIFSAVGLVSACPGQGTSGANSSCFSHGPGAVYTIDNAATGNMVIKYDRDSNGTLTPSGTFSTQGLGTGTGLGSQGAVVLTDNGSWLLAVDAGSNEISVFKVTTSSLNLTDKVSSNGMTPISVTSHGGIVYVLNSGGTPNIAGFVLSSSGMLTPIIGSVQPLSGVANSSPEQIGFNNDGKVLVVAEKGSNIIDTYTVNAAGVASGPTTHASNNPGPYGFAFDDKGNLIISEAANGTLSSYAVMDNGGLTLISGSVPDFGSAPCWVVITKDNQVFTSNAHGGTISSYASNSGALVLSSSVAANVKIPALDLALSNDSGYLYNLNGNTITGFLVNPGGNLSQVTEVSGLPCSTTGLAAS